MSSRGTDSGLRALREPMQATHDRACNVDVRAYEVTPAEVVATELRPLVCEIVREARTLLASVLDACDAALLEVMQDRGERNIRSSYLPFELAVDATMETARGSRRAIEEIAFVAQLELHQREARLERVQSEHGTALLIGEADSALRRTRKGLSAVESTIASSLSLSPLLDFRSELELSLAVRRAYAKFCASLDLHTEPPKEDLHHRFRAAGTQIAMLVGWEVYPDLRVRDRLLLRDFQQRILVWLRRTDTDRIADGLRLWQDLAASLEMFCLVNRRAELVEHDSKLVQRSLEELRTTAPKVSDRTWASLQPLLGLDPSLDALLGAAQRPPAQHLLDALERLAAHFGTPSAPMSSEGSAAW